MNLTWLQNTTDLQAMIEHLEEVCDADDDASEVANRLLDALLDFEEWCETFVEEDVFDVYDARESLDEIIELLEAHELAVVQKVRVWSRRLASESRFTRLAGLQYENRKQANLTKLLRDARFHCPRCGLKMTIRYRRVDDEPFWGCTGYDACTYTRPMSEEHKKLLEP